MRNIMMHKGGLRRHGFCLCCPAFKLCRFLLLILISSSSGVSSLRFVGLVSSLTGRTDPNCPLLIFKCYTPGGCQVKKTGLNNIYHYLWQHSSRPTLVLLSRFAHDVNWSPAQYTGVTELKVRTSSCLIPWYEIRGEAGCS